jgi:hypothetical protein
MEEILQDINEFPFIQLSGVIVFIVAHSIGAYFLRPCEPRIFLRQHWKSALILIIIWLNVSSNVMDRPFVSKENFNSLTKMEGILKYTDDEGFYFELNQNEDFLIKAHLLDYIDNIGKYTEKSVLIWQKNHIAYQLEYNGEVIYSLERSNAKVWLGVIWDLIRFYMGVLCYLGFYYLVILRCLKDLKEWYEE